MLPEPISCVSNREKNANGEILIYYDKKTTGKLSTFILKPGIYAELTSTLIMTGESVSGVLVAVGSLGTSC